MTDTKKTVLITGSTRGIGLAVAEHYTKAGWNVIGTARAKSNTDQLVALSPFKIVTLDTSNETSVLEAAQQLEGVPIDLLINNAGIAQVTTFATVTKESFVHQFLHCKSSVMGSISNNKEENAYMSRGQYGYTAPKAALNMVTRSLAMDLLERNISVVTANLGFVDTEMNNHQGIVNPADTAASMAEIVAKMSLEDSGKSFDADPTTPGSELPW